MSEPVLHPGDVVHSMDHFVMELATARPPTSYFTIYALGLMPAVGSGHVALASVDHGGRRLDLCLAESLQLGERMQQRLRALGGGAVPAGAVAAAPQLAHFSRLVSAGGEYRWVVESAAHRIEARWGGAEPAFWVSAPAPAFHPTRDYTSTFVGHWQAELVVDGLPVPGRPFDHAWWEERLGRRFSSCHVALAETAVEAE